MISAGTQNWTEYVTKMPKEYTIFTNWYNLLKKIQNLVILSISLVFLFYFYKVNKKYRTHQLKMLSCKKKKKSQVMSPKFVMIHVYLTLRSLKGWNVVHKNLEHIIWRVYFVLSQYSETTLSPMKNKCFFNFLFKNWGIPVCLWNSES
jgi:hypothetical protein